MSFGESTCIYDRGRRLYPAEVVDTIQAEMSRHKPFLVLDMGCGTGIATRQLASPDGLIVGCDIDGEMVEAALKHQSSHVSYCSGAANNLPFGSQLFDGVTAFGAFHWFCDAHSVSELKRVLKPGGGIWIVNKDDVGSFRAELDAILAEYVSVPYNSPKTAYEPNRILRDSGYKDVTQRTFSAVEQFTLGELLTLVRSMNLWVTVPSDKRDAMLESIMRHFSAKLNVENYYERQVVVTTVSGVKPI